MPDNDLLELAAAYADETGLSLHICAAFVAAEQEPPHRDFVDRMGYSAIQTATIQQYFDKHDPYGHRAEWAEFAGNSVDNQ